MARRSDLLLIAALLASGCRGDQNVEPPPPSVAKSLMRDTPPVVDARVDPPRGATVRLYAPDVALGKLPLSLSIATLGGVSTVMVPAGTPLPTSHRETFSTAQDDQSTVEIAVVQGERPLAADNHDVGKFQLIGVPPAPRGIPQIDVTFTIDRDGVLEVTAVDRANPNHVNRVIVEASGAGPVDRARLAKLVFNSAEAKPVDAAKRATADAKLQLDTMVYSSKKLYADVGAKVPEPMRKRWQAALQRAEVALQAGDKALYERAYKDLQAVTHDVAEQLYKDAKP